MMLFLTTWLLLLSLISSVHSCRLRVWAVGLRKNQTLENHLDFVGQAIPIQQLKPEINGYTISASDDHAELVEAIRKDPSVGFAVKIPEHYFRKVLDAQARLIAQLASEGLTEFDLLDFRLDDNHFWRNLQERDPEVFDDDFSRRRVPLEWVVQLEDGYHLDEHINSVTQLNPHSVAISPTWQKNSHIIRFKSEEQERKHLHLIYEDPRVVDIFPERCRQPNITFFTRTDDGKYVPGWEDPCVWKVGYRRWGTKTVYSVDSKATKGPFVEVEEWSGMAGPAPSSRSKG